MWLTMIILHAAAGVVAFAVGIAALQPRRVRRHRWLPTLLAWLLAGMVLFMVGAMATHWGDLAGAPQIVSSGLVVLALYMLHRALRARGAAKHLTAAHQTRYLDNIGFILIALFNGFVIVSTLDLGAPPWFVGPFAVLAVVVGHHAIAQAKSRAGLAV